MSKRMSTPTGKRAAAPLNPAKADGHTTALQVDTRLDTQKKPRMKSHGAGKKSDCLLCRRVYLRLSPCRAVFRSRRQVSQPCQHGNAGRMYSLFPFKHAPHVMPPHTARSRTKAVAPVVFLERCPARFTMRQFSHSTALPLSAEYASPASASKTAPSGHSPARNAPGPYVFPARGKARAKRPLPSGKRQGQKGRKARPGID